MVVFSVQSGLSTIKEKKYFGDFAIWLQSSYFLIGQNLARNNLLVNKLVLVVIRHEACEL